MWAKIKLRDALGLDARKFSCAEISTFTVIITGIFYAKLIKSAILHGFKYAFMQLLDSVCYNNGNIT